MIMLAITKSLALRSQDKGIWAGLFSGPGSKGPSTLPSGASGALQVAWGRHMGLIMSGRFWLGLPLASWAGWTCSGQPGTLSNCCLLRAGLWFECVIICSSGPWLTWRCADWWLKEKFWVFLAYWAIAEDCCLLQKFPDILKYMVLI